MQKSRLTVYFNGTLWIGVYERISDGRLEACKILFGAEPKDYEVCQFLLQNWNESKGTGTKSQQALKLQHEQIKTGRKAVSREKKEAEARRQFELKQQKKKEKHRGRKHCSVLFKNQESEGCHP